MARRGKKSDWPSGALYMLAIAVVMGGISGSQLWKRANLATAGFSCESRVTYDRTSKSGRSEYDGFTVRCLDGGGRSEPWSGTTSQIDRAAIVASTRAYEIDGHLIPEGAVDHVMRMITNKILAALSLVTLVISLIVIVRWAGRSKAKA